VGFRFITSCDSSKGATIFDDQKFTFYIENYIYLSLKILLLLLLSLRLFRISRSPSFSSPQIHRPLLLLHLILFLSVLNQLTNMILLPRTPNTFRQSPPLYMSGYILDLVLMCALTVQVLVMRRLELEALVAMGVFKDLQQMNDRELFVEYDKMLK
jgi:hypothetical protein